MEKKYNCISVVKFAKAMFIGLLVVLPNLLIAQQAPSIQTGVTFQWLEATQPDGTYPATIESVTIDGQVYNSFVVPTDYEMTRVGHNGHSHNHIKENSATIFNDSSDPLWHNAALSAFQDKNLNHFFSCSNNGRNICLDFDAVAATDAQKQTIFYNPSIPANEGGVLAITERNANNCYHIAVFGTPVGGGAEQFLGETFVRSNNNSINGAFYPPNQIPNSGTDYWLTDRTVEQNKTLGMALFYLSDIVPIGSKITKIEFNASTNDHGDGKFLIMQKYAVDNHQINCINERYSGDLKLTNNAPENSTYTLVSAPTPAGDFFEFNTDGTYTYTPTADFTGEVSFEYSVCLPSPNQTVCDQASVFMNFVDLPPNPTYTVDCNVAGDFTIEVTSPLGTEFEYKLNGMAYQSSPTFTVPTGAYNLVIKNVNSNCEKYFTDNPIMVSNMKITADITDVSCKLGDDGAIDISVSGGTTPYTYSWSNSATSEDLSNIYANTYTVTVTDANGCTKSESFEVEQPAEELAVEVDWIKHVDCFGNNSGDFKVEGSGGTPPYLYSDDGGLTTQSSDFFAPPYYAGNYTITIIDSKDCTSTVDLEITEPDELIVTASSITNVECNGDNTGAIYLNVEGGTPPIYYTWDDGSTNDNLTNLSAGTYNVTVADYYGCSVSKSVTVSEPPFKNLNSEIYAATCNNAGTFDDASDDFITFTVEPDAPTDYFQHPYTYNVTATQNGSPVNVYYNKTLYTSDSNVISEEIANNVSYGYSTDFIIHNGGLGLGDFVITITSNPCGLTETLNLTNPGTCSENCVPEATNQQVTYTFESDFIFTDIDEFAVNIPKFDPGSTRTLTQVDVSYSSEFRSALLFENTTTNGFVRGAIDANVSYSIGSLSAITANLELARTNGYATSQYIPINEEVLVPAEGNWPGDSMPSESTYNGMQEAFNLFVSKSFLLGIDPTNNPLWVTNIINDPTTDDDIVYILDTTLDSGNSVYTSVSDLGNFIGTGVLPLNFETNSNSSSSSTGSSLINFMSNARYKYEVTYTYNVSESIVIGTITPTNANCNGEASGSATASVFGDATPFTYIWSNSEGNPIGTNSPTLSNVVAGTYSLKVIDANDCEVTDSVTISEPSALTANFVYNNSVKCFSEETGSIKYIGEGGSPPYSYSINDGSTTQSESYFENLAAGNYTFTVIDANDCEYTIDFEITEPDALNLSVTKVDATSTQGCDNGSADASTTGGTAPYTYLWSASASNQTTANATNLPVGDHTVVVTDANDCTTSQTITISCTDDCDIVTNSGTITNVLCNGNDTGAATVSASSVINPTATFTFTWSNG
ncbi:choice-of-anchor E domain-containing protein, partial [uncultured Winogradskyella sp.]|uniref:choice-of-anchor E domain-containing protein n=1 Tax=uncultured Winogradskyella sp. TaxID=395353 RepID=UPI0026235F0B